ncbi:ATP-dependent DNA helicase MER3 [Basidiobolus ranarum]|uniref:DNA 3'-5' helicase n=1 Tax=Basidiobolus ranarum TaxID=34480 RepID=A0ABR2W4F3_9FUNG
MLISSSHVDPLKIKNSKNVLKEHNLKQRISKEYIKAGIAFHHAGLDYKDRKVVEQLFLNSHLKVICTTTTLAVGVNFPAYLVIIKSTLGYNNSKYQEYSELDILQMIGRAGRPQFDKAGVVVIMTSSENKEKYEQLISGNETIESSLHENLIEHLNAEICLGTITSVEEAIKWLKSTFLYVRIKSNPEHYMVEAKFKAQQNSEKALEGIGVNGLASLDKNGLVEMNLTTSKIIATAFGKCMAKYYIKLGTMVHICKMTWGASVRELVSGEQKSYIDHNLINVKKLEILSKAEEFSELRIQSGEKSVLNKENKNTSLKFPLKGKVKTVDERIFLMIQEEYRSQTQRYKQR